MTLRTTRRLLALALATVAAMTAGTTAGATARSDAAPQAARTTPAALDQALRKLWEDHVTWTRMVIVSFAADLPDLRVAEARLLRNQADIGNAIKPYYGAAAGNALTKLLRAHILGAVPVLEAAKAGRKAELARALKAWYANADQIAAFLSHANPAHWPLATMRQMMHRHLELTTREAVARLGARWSADVAAYDAVHREILEMADMLADGIVAQFPERFAA